MPNAFVDPVRFRFTCAPEWLQAEAAPAPQEAAPPAPTPAPAPPPPLPRFSMVAYTGAPMQVGAWRYPVVVDLAGLRIPSQQRPIRLGHDASQGVGHTEAIRVEQGHLVARGVVSRATGAAQEVVTSSRNGFPWQASIGATVTEAEFVKDGQKAVVNGQQVQGPVNIVRKSVLGEISFVDLGADGDTSARIEAQPSKENPVDQNDLQPQETGDVNADGGATNAPASPATVQATAPATVPMPLSDTPSPVQAIRAEAAAETERIVAIRKLCGDPHADIAAKAIRDGWNPLRCELELLRASRPAAPAVHVPAHDLTPQVLEAACAISGKLESADKAYAPEALDMAHKRFRGSISLQELFLEAAWLNGYTGRSFRDTREVMRFAFGRQIQAGLSNVDIGGILANIANKFMLQGFYSVEGTWRNISAVRNVSDFKTVTSYRLIGKDTYEPVAPGGELKHGTLGEEKFTNKADTYGLMFSIDRRDLINDDLGAISLVPRKLGRGSGLKINDVFWTAFLNSAAFFTAANKNLLTGADSALGIDGLTKAETAFLEQVDGDGKPIGIMPSIVLVPPAQSAVATQLNRSVELRDTTVSTRYPVANPHQGKFRTEVSRYLSNATFPGSSSKAWYLLADAGDLAVIEMAFLNGQEAPIIESAEANFETLGVQMRGYHDFGCALQDPRGGLKNAGQ
ncbi:MAG: hypothetical protein ACREJ2_03540 [Planctomycetota bacterium]